NETLVEASDLLEHFTAHGHARPSDCQIITIPVRAAKDAGVIFRRIGERVSGKSTEAHNRSSVLNGAVWPQQLCTDRTDLFHLNPADQFLQPLGIDSFYVIIKK